MKYLYIFLILLLNNTLSFSQVNQSKSICSGATINLTSDDFGLPDTTNYTWNYSVGAGTVSGFNSTSTSVKIFNQRNKKKSIPFRFAKHNMSSKIVGWLVGARDGKVLFIYFPEFFRNFLVSPKFRN